MELEREANRLLRSNSDAAQNSIDLVRPLRKNSDKLKKKLKEKEVLLKRTQIQRESVLKNFIEKQSMSDKIIKEHESKIKDQKIKLD